MKYTAEIRPKKGDIVEWNWAGGTRATVRDFDGKRAELRYDLGRGRIGRALAFPASLKLIERPKEQPAKEVA